MRARGQAGFREGKSTLDHNLTLHTLIKQDKFASRDLFVDFKAFDIVPHDKLWECLQQLGAPPHLQYIVKAMYTAVYAKV